MEANRQTITLSSLQVGVCNLFGSVLLIAAAVQHRDERCDAAAELEYPPGLQWRCASLPYHHQKHRCCLRASRGHHHPGELIAVQVHAMLVVMAGLVTAVAPAIHPSSSTLPPHMHTRIAPGDAQDALPDQWGGQAAHTAHCAWHHCRGRGEAAVQRWAAGSS